MSNINEATAYGTCVKVEFIPNKINANGIIFLLVCVKVKDIPNMPAFLF